MLDISSVDLQNHFSKHSVPMYIRIARCHGRCDVYVLANQYILLQVDVGHHDILLKSQPRYIIGQ